MRKNVRSSLQFTHKSIKHHEAFEEFDVINVLID